MSSSSEIVPFEEKHEVAVLGVPSMEQRLNEIKEKSEDRKKKARELAQKRQLEEAEMKAAIEEAEDKLSRLKEEAAYALAMKKNTSKLEFLKAEAKSMEDKIKTLTSIPVDNITKAKSIFDLGTDSSWGDQACGGAGGGGAGGGGGGGGGGAGGGAPITWRKVAADGRHPIEPPQDNPGRLAISSRSVPENTTRSRCKYIVRGNYCYGDCYGNCDDEHPPGYEVGPRVFCFWGSKCRFKDFEDPEVRCKYNHNDTLPSDGSFVPGKPWYGTFIPKK